MVAMVAILFVMFRRSFLPKKQGNPGAFKRNSLRRPKFKLAKTTKESQVQEDIRRSLRMIFFFPKASQRKIGRAKKVEVCGQQIDLM